MRDERSMCVCPLCVLLLRVCLSPCSVYDCVSMVVRVCVFCGLCYEWCMCLHTHVCVVDAFVSVHCRGCIRVRLCVCVRAFG